MSSPPYPLTFLVGLLLLTTSLAGCINPDDGTDASNLEWSTYEEAKTAQGQTFEPNETSPIRLKWLRPTAPDAVPQGPNNLFLLLYNSETDEPVTDAQISLASRMPAMEHGTASEQDPAHQSHGVYKGIINPSMGGDWVLNLQATLETGAALGFHIGYSATGGMDDEMDHSEELPRFQSYEEAKHANGTAHHPHGHHDSDIRLKLLHPANDPPSVQGPGAHGVVFVLYNETSDTPVRDATMQLESWMPPHETESGGYMSGHGTGNAPETDPTHQEHGVYEGEMNPIMNGTWLLNLTHDRAGSEDLLFSITYHAGEGSHDHAEHAHAPEYESYEEARQADGRVFEPNTTYPGPIRLKMLDPAHAETNHTGEQHITFLLYDVETDEPIQSADFSHDTDHCEEGTDDAFCAWMPPMGHGTSPEESPTYQEHGVYTGKTNLSMAGDWELQFNPTIDGDTIPFDVPLYVTEAGDHGGHDEH